VPHGRRPHEPLGPDFPAVRPDDFQRHSIDGLGDDWPITYDDIKPYYDAIDRFIGIFGSNEGFRTSRTAFSCRRRRRVVTSS
jgi:choline dehydrogenase-like flavoprotein